MKVRFAVAPGVRSFDADAVMAAATTAESLGFDTIWLSDVPLSPIGDPLISLAHIAARTTRLKLGANVVPIGRNPMILARQLAQLDRATEGRLLLSFVPGLDQPGERAALGFSSGDRWARIERDIGLLRRWWAGEVVTFSDVDATFEHIGVAPTPLQDPLEIWLGGAGPRARERVGRCADGWLTANVTPSEAASGRADIVNHAAAAGRTIDPEHFGISIPFARERVDTGVVDALRARRLDRDLDGIVPVGANQILDLVQRHVDAGLSKFVLRPVEDDPSGTDAAGLAWLAHVVLPLQC